jgi:hypothetical protein
MFNGQFAADGIEPLPKSTQPCRGGDGSADAVIFDAKLAIREFDNDLRGASVLASVGDQFLRGPQQRLTEGIAQRGARRVRPHNDTRRALVLLHRVQRFNECRGRLLSQIRHHCSQISQQETRECGSAGDAASRLIGLASLGQLQLEAECHEVMAQNIVEVASDSQTLAIAGA